MRKIVNGFLDVFTDIVSSVSHLLFWFIIIVASLVFNAVSRHPFDDPRAGSLYTMQIVSIVGFWIECLMKVQQKLQSKTAQDQMDRIEQLIGKVEDLAEELLRNGKLSEHLIMSLDAAVDTMIAHYTEKEQRGQTDVRPSDPHS